MFSPVTLSSLGMSSFSSKSSADDQSIGAKTDQAPSILSSSIATFAFGFLDEEPAAAPDEYGGGLFVLVDDELDPFLFKLPDKFPLELSFEDDLFLSSAARLRHSSRLWPFLPQCQHVTHGVCFPPPDFAPGLSLATVTKAVPFVSVEGALPFDFRIFCRSHSSIASCIKSSASKSSILGSVA